MPTSRSCNGASNRERSAAVICRCVKHRGTLSICRPSISSERCISRPCTSASPAVVMEGARNVHHEVRALEYKQVRSRSCGRGCSEQHRSRAAPVLERAAHLCLANVESSTDAHAWADADAQTLARERSGRHAMTAVHLHAAVPSGERSPSRTPLTSSSAVSLADERA